jgi:hypothetical protein
MLALYFQVSVAEMPRGLWTSVNMPSASSDQLLRGGSSMSPGRAHDRTVSSN